MSDNAWDIKELRELFIKAYGAALLPRFEEYTQTLHWKQWTAMCHAKKSKELWDEFFKMDKVDFRDLKFSKTLDLSTVELEAMAHSMHSMGDILGQIINITIFGADGFSEDSCSLNKVMDKLEEERIAPDILSLLISFKDSPEFKYISAFCNTIKHRKLVDMEYYSHIDCREKGMIEEGARLKEFTYNGDSFPATWFHKIEEDYRVKIYGLLCDVGRGINIYLKSKNNN
jgi:hypothetical protein